MQPIPPDAPVPKLIIWRGSQFSTKAIAAFAVKGILPGKGLQLASVPNALEKRKDLLPAPHTVPALAWDGDVVLGTDDICAYLDKRLPNAPLLYPNDDADAVRQLERRCADLYWLNGWLSQVDVDGFERYAGERARKYVRKTYGTFGRGLLWAAPKRVNKLIHSVSQKGWVEMLQRRGPPSAQWLADAQVTTQAVIDATRKELAALDQLLAVSKTVHFCDSATPTAADLTLYGMLERWVGNSLMPGVHDGAQPRLLDGFEALKANWEAMRGAFQHDCSLVNLDDYKDITVPLGAVTFPPASAPAGAS